MAIFQDDNVKIHQPQIVKEWLWGSMKNQYISMKKMHKYSLGLL